jgi:hypothetical protein
MGSSVEVKYARTIDQEASFTLHPFCKSLPGVMGCQPLPIVTIEQARRFLRSAGSFPVLSDDCSSKRFGRNCSRVMNLKGSPWTQNSFQKTSS